MLGMNRERRGGRAYDELRGLTGLLRAGARRAPVRGRGEPDACPRCGGAERTSRARACGVCPGTSWLVRTGLCEGVGRALAPSGSGSTVSC